MALRQLAERGIQRLALVFLLGDPARGARDDRPARRAAGRADRRRPAPSPGVERGVDQDRPQPGAELPGVRPRKSENCRQASTNVPWTRSEVAGSPASLDHRPRWATSRR